MKEVDIDDDGVGWINKLTVKVSMDLSKPIAQGLTIAVKECNIGFPFSMSTYQKFALNVATLFVKNHAKEMVNRTTMQTMKFLWVLKFMKIST